MEQYLNQLAAVWGKYILPILEFVIGLGVIVFVHELGHFIVAKWVGIKVEQFAFGFGKRLCGFVIGETDYRINLVPLGGYVKMLGQEDFKPLKEGDKPDPRAFDQKSVGARFAVISAGVIMNVILAAVLFTIVARVGMDSPAPVIASVLPGTPAYKATVQFEGAPAPATVPASLVPQTPPMILAAPAAIRPAYDPWNNRLQPGDKIVRISGSNIILWLNSGRIPTMQEVMLASALSSKDDLYDFTIERTVGKVTRTGKADQVGVTFDGEKMIFGLGSPALIPVIGKSDNAVDIRPFQVDDRIIKIGDESIDNEWDISRVEDTLNGGPVTVTVDRGPKTEELNIQPGLRKADDYVFSPDGASFHCRITEVNRDEDKAVTSYTVQTDDGKERKLTEDQMDLSLGNLVNFLGMSPRLKVVTVLEGSPADKKGLKPGDIIQAYGDKRNPAYKELVDVSKDKSRKNAETEIEVLRGQESKTIAITPKNRNDTAVLGILVGGDWEHLVVAGPAADSPAAKAGIENGATITEVNGQPVKTWIGLYNALRDGIGRELTITYLPLRGDAAGTPKTVAVGKGSLAIAMFDPSAYRFSVLGPETPLKPLNVNIQTDNPLEAIERGGKETLTFILGTYVSLRSMIMRTASVKSAMGPLGLGAAAVKLAQDSFIRFVWFFAMISAAIAVFNFLPLPVMDGGYAVFLLVEKIRGKPLSVRLTNYIQMTGLVLILGLFLLITYQDIMRMIRGSWW